MGKRGPPPADPADQRRYPVKVYFSEEELKTLERLLGREGLAAATLRRGGRGELGSKYIAEFLRSRALGRDVPAYVPKVNREMHHELARTGANIRMILESLKEGSLDISADDQLDAIRRDIAAFSEVLLGTMRSVTSGPDDSKEFEFEENPSLMDPTWP